MKIQKPTPGRIVEFTSLGTLLQEVCQRNPAVIKEHRGAGKVALRVLTFECNSTRISVPYDPDGATETWRYYQPTSETIDVETPAEIAGIGAPPTHDAFVAIGAERISDQQIQTATSLHAAQIELAEKAGVPVSIVQSTT